MDSRMNKRNEFGLSTNGIKTALTSSTVNGLCLQILTREVVKIGQQTRLKLTLSDGEFSSNAFILMKTSETDDVDLVRYQILDITQGKSFMFQGDNAVLIQKWAVSSDEEADDILGKPAMFKSLSFATSQPFVPLQDLVVDSKEVSVQCQVTFKTPIKQYTRNGQLKTYFNVHLQDKTAVSRATAFSNVQSLFDSIQVGSSYLFTNMITKAEEDARYAVGKVQLNFSSNSEVLERPSTDLVPIPFSFSTILAIQDMAADQSVDLIVVITGVSEMNSVSSQGSSKTLMKREVVILDSSLHMITLTLWSQDAELFSFKPIDVISIRRARVSNFGGKSLVASNITEIQLGTHLNEGKGLASWYRKQPKNVSYVNLTNVAAGVTEKDCQEMLLVEIEDSPASTDPIYIKSLVRVKSIDSNEAIYMSCPNVKCKKKVIAQDDSFFCAKCFTEVSHPCPRLIINMSIEDDSASTAAVAFQSVAELILKITAVELMSLKETSTESYNKTFVNAVGSEFNALLKISYKQLEKGLKRTTEIFKLLTPAKVSRKRKKPKSKD